MKFNLQLFARAQSWNWELDLGGGEIVFIQTLGEISEGGQEGRIEVVDGSKKYRIGDQIYDIGEIETSVLIKNKIERRDYDLMNAFSKARPKDIFAIGRDSQGVPQMTYLLSNCGCAKGTKGAFDRKSKAEETHKFVLMPEDVKEVT